MMQMVNKRRNKKGFTLVELVVVIAILGILAAIAIPRFSGIQDSSKIKADGATAAQIVAAARIQETETGFTVTSVTQPATEVAPTTTAATLQKKYMKVPTNSQSGTKGIFKISGGGTTDYKVIWAKDASNVYEYIENTKFSDTAVAGTI